MVETWPCIGYVRMFRLHKSNPDVGCAAPGDSGALVLREDGFFLGMAFASTPKASSTYVLPSKDLLTSIAPYHHEWQLSGLLPVVVPDELKMRTTYQPMYNNPISPTVPANMPVPVPPVIDNMTSVAFFPPDDAVERPHSPALLPFSQPQDQDRPIHKQTELWHPSFTVREDSDDVQWTTVHYTEDDPWTERKCTFRCDIDSVDLNSLSEEFKRENAKSRQEMSTVHPRPASKVEIGWAVGRVKPVPTGAAELDSYGDQDL